MFYEHEIAENIYSKYLNGMSVEDITLYVNIFEKLEMKPLDIEEIIDYFNTLLF